jgi:predicted aspartyl protease
MMMKSRSVALYRILKTQNIGLVDTVFEELVSDRSFIETCNLLSSNTIRLDQQYKEKAAKQIHNTSKSYNRAKKDKVKKVLALINEIKFMIQMSMENMQIYYFI